MLPDCSFKESQGDEADLAMVRGALRGDAAALEVLVRRMGCIPLMLAARNSRMRHPLSQHEILDVAQDTFVAIWRQLPKFQGLSSLESWVYPFCSFALMHSFRTRQRRPPGDPLPEELPGPRQQSPLELHFLHQAMLLLDPLEEQVVRLKHYEGCTFEEIGARLAIPRNTAKTRYYRAIRRLHNELCREAPEGMA